GWARAASGNLRGAGGNAVARGDGAGGGGRGTCGGGSAALLSGADVPGAGADRERRRRIAARGAARIPARGGLPAGADGGDAGAVCGARGNRGRFSAGGHVSGADRAAGRHGGIAARVQPGDAAVGAAGGTRDARAAGGEGWRVMGDRWRWRGERGGETTGATRRTQWKRRARRDAGRRTAERQFVSVVSRAARGDGRAW